MERSQALKIILAHWAYWHSTTIITPLNSIRLTMMDKAKNIDQDLPGAILIWFGTVDPQYTQLKEFSEDWGHIIDELTINIPLIILGKQDINDYILKYYTQ